MSDERDPRDVAMAGAASAEAGSSSHGPIDANLASGNVTIGGVRLRSFIGAGAMGRVYLGRHEVLDIDVAVKVVSDPRTNADRFLSEARLAARIQHDNVMRILHAGREKGYLFLVLEYVDGPTLKSVRNEFGRMPWRKACDLVMQAARGLGAAHRAGIVHRDVKPSNLMGTKEGMVKVTDLGLARETAAEDGPTAFGAVLGTAAYMAPEQARDSRSAGAQADVYALGIILYELISGDLPFRRDSITSLLLDHINKPPPDIGTIVPGLPKDVIALINRMLAKDPSRRPCDGTEVAKLIEGMLGVAMAETEVTRSPLARKTLRQRLMLSATIVAVAAIVIAIATGGPHAAVAADAGIPAPAPAAAAAIADSWQTPARAVFLLSDRLDAKDVTALTAAMSASKLRVIDRQHIENALREHDMAIAGRVDAATAVRVGRIIGGQIALCATRHADDAIEVSSFVVETTEIAGQEVVGADKQAETASALIKQALALLPAQGYVERNGQEWMVSLGSYHGLAVGDRLELRDGTADVPGKVVGHAEVVKVERATARVRSELAELPHLARKAEQ